MRLHQFLALAAPFALLLPISAQAAWPAGEKANYMKDCVAAASQSVDAKTATSHCDCGANVLEKKFTTDEIKQLLNTKTPPPAALRDRALTEVSACKVK